MNVIAITAAHTQPDQFRFVPVSRLSLSPLNVRQTGAEQGTEELAALIRAQGVLQNLTVYEEAATGRRRAGMCCVVAGGRRLRALQLLVKEKHITADYEVPCLIISYERAVEISLAENSGREGMHPADQFEAFRKLIDAGQSIEDVAARFGVSPLIVQRRLKLANVCPEFVELYRQRSITLEHLVAFAVTDDHERQRQAWKGLKAYERHPSTLRRVLTENEVSQRDPLARFVGLKAYQKAGGQIRRDLFAEKEDAFLLDPALLNRLATEKLEQHAAKLKREGAAWVEIEPRLDYSARAAYGRVRTILREPTEEERAKLDALTSRKAEAERHMAAETDEERLNQLSEELDAIDAEREAIDEVRTVPHPEQQSLAGALVSIDSDGKVYIDNGLLKPEDAKRFTRAPKNDGTDAPDAPREHSAALMRRLTAHRTLALQATLMGRPDVALIALAHRLVLRTFFIGGSSASAVCIDTDTPALQQHAPDLAECKAQVAVETQRERLRAQLPEDPETVFGWLLTQPQATVLELLAFCVAVTVDAVLSQPRTHASGALAQAAGLDMRTWWTPTAENYFGSIPRARILEIVSEAVSPDAVASLSKLKKRDLALAAEQRVAGTGWLPTVLRTAAG